MFCLFAPSFQAASAGTSCRFLSSQSNCSFRSPPPLPSKPSRVISSCVFFLILNFQSFSFLLLLVALALKPPQSISPGGKF
eukprot:m.174916 g.174916  ORF g.174916 m.174916 type:complete len:81 (+) comp25289_c0_seq1:1407-1649(+)